MVDPSAYDIHPTLWEDMRRAIMKTVFMYRDRDSELKRDQHRAYTTTPTDTAPVEPCASSSGWQPPPHMWPSTVQNPVCVCGSTEPAWMHHQQHPSVGCGHQLPLWAELVSRGRASAGSAGGG